MKLHFDVPIIGPFSRDTLKNKMKGPPSVIVFSQKGRVRTKIVFVSATKRASSFLCFRNSIVHVILILFVRTANDSGIIR